MKPQQPSSTDFDSQYLHPTKKWLANYIVAHSKPVRARFAHVYTQLEGLPRRTRRLLTKKFALSLAHLALVMALTGAPVYANNITVTTTIPDLNDGDGQCSLMEALYNANDSFDGQPYLDCADGDENGADTITLSGNSYDVTDGFVFDYGDTGLPLIESTVIIEGNGATIRRVAPITETFRLFTVLSTGDLTLDDVTIANGYLTDADEGGGGIFSYGGPVRIVNSSVISGNHVAAGSGGGIGFYGNASLLAIDNSQIVNNTASLGGGGIYSSGITATVTITNNSVISGNHALGRVGGGVFNQGNSNALLTVFNSRVSGNTAVQQGGGLFNESQMGIATVSLTGGQVIQNESTTRSGGGVYNYSRYDDATLLVVSSNISNNDGGGNGGGLHNYSYYGNAIADISANSVISGNQALNSGQGGGLRNYSFYGDGVVTIDNSRIISNTSPDDGGGIYNGGYSAIVNVVNNAVISGNVVDNGDGGGIYNFAYDGQAAIYVTDSRVDNNQALPSRPFSSGMKGGGLLNHSAAGGDAVVVVDNGHISGNLSETSGSGIYNRVRSAYAASVTIQNGSVISGNTTPVVVGPIIFVPGGGGGIFNFASDEAAQANMTIMNSTVSGNRTIVGGGGVLNTGVVSGTVATTVQTLISDSIISNNEADGLGGGIWHMLGTLTVTNSIVSGNSAAVGGGIAQFFTPIFSIGDGGGELFNQVDGNVFALQDAIVSGHLQQGSLAGSGAKMNLGNGSLVMMPLSSSLIIGNGSQIEGNYARYTGGGIHSRGYLSHTNDISIEGSIISGNGSGGIGGGMTHAADDGPSTLMIERSIIVNNYASEYGGGLSQIGRNDTAVATIVNSTISGNTVVTRAAGIDNYAVNGLASLTLSNSTVTGNSVFDAAGGGGGIYNRTITGTAVVTLERSLVSGNNAAFGAELYNMDTAVVDGYNVFGHSGSDGMVGVVIGGSDITTLRPLNEVLDTTLADNGGGIPTHALVSTSPAIDVQDQAACGPMPVNGVDQRGEVRDDWRCDAGAFELKLTDSTSVTKDIEALTRFTFGPTLGIVDVVDMGGCLDTVTFNLVSTDHPSATGGMQNGRYWEISQTGCTLSDTFTVDLTLPHVTTPDGGDKVCRFDDITLMWDCAADSFDIGNNTITRNGVSVFSDWTTGDDVGPTAVVLDAVAAVAQNGSLAATVLGTVGAVLSGLWLGLRRKK